MNAHTLPANARRTQWDRLEGLDTPRCRLPGPQPKKGGGRDRTSPRGRHPATQKLISGHSLR